MSDRQAREERALVERIEAASTEEYAQILAHASGWEERVLRLHLGEETFRRQEALVQQGRWQRSARLRGNVVVLPGLLGSEVTLVGMGGSREQIWMDPLRIAMGGMEKIRLAPNGSDPPGQDVRATGILKMIYGELLLALRLHWNVRAFWYDWRKDLKTSASHLAVALDEWFPDDEPVHFVAHSMGGLVARTCIALHPHRWKKAPSSRLIMLGTPNHGSFLVPQALTGVAQLLRLLAAMDLRHTPAELARIVGSFVGLVQMLPEPEVFPSAGALYRQATYSPDLFVSQHHLDVAAEHHALLRDDPDAADADRMIVVAGHAHPTPFQMSTEPLPLGAPGDGIRRYTHGLQGDGVVPHASARLSDKSGKEVPVFHVRADHTLLPCDLTLLTHIDSLLTSRIEEIDLPRLPAALTSTAPEASDTTLSDRVAKQREEADRNVRRLVTRLVSTSRENAPSPISSTAREITREILSHATGVPPAAIDPAGDGPVERPKITLLVVPGDLASLDDIASLSGAGDPPVDAIALKHYVAIEPGAALHSVDMQVSRRLAEKARLPISTNPPRRSDLILSQYIDRGVIRGDRGALFFMEDPRCPAGRERTLVIAGMGYKPRLGAPETMQVVKELCWALGRLGKKHLATQLFGSGPGGLSVREAVTAWVRGIKHAITGEPLSLDRITFVEKDRGRVDEIVREIKRQRDDLWWTKQKRMDIRVEQLLPNEALAEPGDVGEATREDAPGEARNVTRISVARDPDGYKFGAVTPNASIPERSISVDEKLVLQANDDLMEEGSGERQIERGQFLTKLLFPADLNPSIFAGEVLILQVDASTARLHWEMAAEPAPLGKDASDQFLGITRGLTRQLRTQLAPPPDPLPPPQRLVRVMVIADPAEDARLEGALEEGMAVADLFEQFNRIYVNTRCRVEVHRFFGPREATRANVLRELMLRTWDVLHFAGHCAYDEKVPEKSGWVFNGGELLTARELQRLDRIPRFVFSNACESGVTPDRPEMRSLDLSPSFAESFFQKGVWNFVCTAWPVDDLAAKLFALKVYEGLLGISAGEAFDPCAMFEAMKRARQLLAEPGETSRGARTWGAYQHYGNPFFRLFDAVALKAQQAAQAPSPRPARAPAASAPSVASASQRPSPVLAAMAEEIRQRTSVSNLFGEGRRPVETGLASPPEEMLKNPEILRQFEIARAAARKLKEDEAAALSEEEVGALLLFAHLALRPSLLVQGGKVRRTDIKPLAKFDDQCPVIGEHIRGVGRIDGYQGPVGTGWLAGPDLLMTNSHVVAVLCGLSIHCNPAWRQDLDERVQHQNRRWKEWPDLRPWWDPGDCPDPEAERVGRIVQIAAVHPQLDMALLRVEGIPDGASRVLVIDAEGPPSAQGEPIYVPGYPVVDEALHPSLARLLFGDTGDWRVPKRVAPGFTCGGEEWILEHDASTLGGSSGSPVVSLATHEVLGLHYMGVHGEANSSVPLWKLRDDPFFKEAGIRFR